MAARSNQTLVRVGEVALADLNISITMVATDPFIAARTSDAPVIILSVVILASCLFMTVMLSLTAYMRGREQRKATKAVETERTQ